MLLSLRSSITSNNANGTTRTSWILSGYNGDSLSRHGTQCVVVYRPPAGGDVGGTAGALTTKQRPPHRQLVSLTPWSWICLTCRIVRGVTDSPYSGRSSWNTGSGVIFCSLLPPFCRSLSVPSANCACEYGGISTPKRASKHAEASGKVSPELLFYAPHSFFCGNTNQQPSRGFVSMAKRRPF